MFLATTKIINYTLYSVLYTVQSSVFSEGKLRSFCKLDRISKTVNCLQECIVYTPADSVYVLNSRQQSENKHSVEDLISYYVALLL
jgi:hypothetical protein